VSFSMFGSRGQVRHRLHKKGRKQRPKRHKLTLWQWARMKILGQKKLPPRPKR